MIRHALIRALDWLDDTVLGHSCYWICHRIGTSSWWDARGEGKGERAEPGGGAP